MFDILQNHSIKLYLIKFHSKQNITKQWNLTCVSRPKILNIPLASYFLINLNFLVPHKAHFDNNIALLLLVFESLGFMFSVFFITL